MKEVDSMKRNRRFLSLLLAICLIAVLLPTAVFAEVSLGTAVTDDEVVSYAGKDWIVIDNNASEITLLLKTPEAPIAYNASGLSNSWDDSDAKVWCANFAAENEIPYEVTFLSHAEAVAYWANNSAASLQTENGWWLRYDNEAVDGALFGIAISDAGFVGTPHVATNYGARPVVKIPADEIAIVEDGALILVDENAFSDVTIDITVASDFSKATATYTGAASGEVYVVLTDPQGNVVKYTSADVSAASGYVELELPAELMGRYTVRAFIADAAVAGAIEVYDFAIADSHGNVVEWNVNVGGDISANFNIVMTEKVLSDDSAKILVSYNNTTKEVSKSDWKKSTTTDGVACVQLPVDMIAPQMNDEITIQVVSDNGSGGEQTFTIREYAEAIVNGNFDDEVKNLAKHMLNYGAKAQTYFNYNADDLANKNVGEPSNMEVVPNDGERAKTPNPVEGISFYGTSLVLNSQTTLRFYFTLSDGKNISEYSFGELKVQSKNISGTMMYFVDIVDIAPDKLGETYSVSVNNKEIVQFNPLWYIKRQAHNDANSQNFKDLMQAMFNYYLAAVDYAG